MPSLPIGEGTWPRLASSAVDIGIWLNELSLPHQRVIDHSLTIGLNREQPGAKNVRVRGEAERRVTPDWAVRTKPLAFAADAAAMDFQCCFGTSVLFLAGILSCWLSRGAR